MELANSASGLAIANRTSTGGRNICLTQANSGGLGPKQQQKAAVGQPKGAQGSGGRQQDDLIWLSLIWLSCG
jgi:hypothetical protein